MANFLPTPNFRLHHKPWHDYMRSMMSVSVLSAGRPTQRLTEGALTQHGRVQNKATQDAEMQIVFTSSVELKSIAWTVFYSDVKRASVCYPAPSLRKRLVVRVPKNASKVTAVGLTAVGNQELRCGIQFTGQGAAFFKAVLMTFQRARFK